MYSLTSTRETAQVGPTLIINTAEVARHYCPTAQDRYKLTPTLTFLPGRLSRAGCTSGLETVVTTTMLAVLKFIVQHSHKDYWLSVSKSFDSFNRNF
ncbi:hypothetical protein J6590_078468 [Homalodisca vitripennis]|nr:hypothetical protein J6590_078468 [Homalodisca vitripennis]